jgi:hypothetical protein
MPTTESQKTYIRNWQATHKEHHLELQRKYSKKNYDANKEIILQNKKEYYQNVIKPRREQAKIAGGLKIAGEIKEAGPLPDPILV